jgi:hypothetical protein
MTAIGMRKNNSLPLPEKEFMISWKTLESEQPAVGLDVVVKNSEGTVYRVYRCACCGLEWRDSIMGSAMLIDPTHWTYVEDYESNYEKPHGRDNPVSPDYPDDGTCPYCGENDWGMADVMMRCKNCGNED